MNTTPLKLVGVLDDSPFDVKSWSGSSYYFFTALKRSGNLHQAISARPSGWQRNIYKVLSLDRDIRKWRFKFNLNVKYYEAMTKAASSAIDALDVASYDVILQVGAWYDLTGRPGKVTVSYHDGNLQTLLKSPYGYPSIKRSYIEAALGHEMCLYGKMSQIFPMSKWLADSFVRDFGVDHRKLYPVGAGVNLPYVREINDKSYEAPKILFVGKDFERKGGPQLLEAFESVRKQFRNASLTIIGPELQHVPEGVKCLGFVSKYTREGVKQLLDEYASASVFVMPSLYEPFGVVFGEAMAHKLPCIGTNICAMPEIIEDGVSGFLAPPNDTKALARKMIELLSAPSLCRQMGEAGYARYKHGFTWDVVAQRIVERVRSLV